VNDFAALREEAAELGLGFDAVNSNTFQDQLGQAHSYANGSLSSQDKGARAQAVAHNIECIEIGHHVPNINIEQIVARLHRFGKLGGFHFNDSKYGDDDLDSGSINPHQLFLIFNELVEAELNPCCLLLRLLPNASPCL
jgi:L-rhamnose isomerase